MEREIKCRKCGARKNMCGNYSEVASQFNKSGWVDDVRHGKAVFICYKCSQPKFQVNIR